MNNGDARQDMLHACGRLKQVLYRTAQCQLEGLVDSAVVGLKRSRRRDASLIIHESLFIHHSFIISHFSLIIRQPSCLKTGK